MTRRRKPLPPDPNVFVQKYYEQQVEQMLDRENLPVVDPDLFKLHSSKPSPARSAPSADRVQSMETRASIRKHEAFKAKKEAQRRARKQPEGE